MPQCLISDTVARLQFAQATVTVFAFVRHAAIYRLHAGPGREPGPALPLDYTTLHVRVGDLSIVVDPFMLAPDEIEACRAGGAEFADLGSSPAGRLEAVGIGASEITHVIATHGHFDHFGGVVSDSGGLAFPDARHLISAADWYDSEAKHWPRLRASWGSLNERGLLDLIHGSQVAVSPSVTLLHTPGDTTGHYVARISTGEGLCFLVGDLFHHPLEVEQPAAYNRNLPALRGRGGAELPRHLVEQQARSRIAIASAAADSGAIVIPAHTGFPGVGSIRRVPSESRNTLFSWVPVRPPELPGFS